MTATTTAAVEAVQSLYAAFQRGDLAYILQNVTPDTVWVNQGPSGIPSSGTYHGPEGVQTFFNRLLSSEKITHFEPSEYFTDGKDSVVALGREACNTVAGKEVSTNWAMVFRLRDGKVARWESYYDTGAYLLAHTK